MDTIPRFKIFLSSTFQDLKPERNAVQQAIHRMGDIYVGMEFFGSFPRQPIAECLQRVRDSDLMVVVLGYRHGSTPKGNKRSFTEREYYAAIENNIPVLAYVADREVYEPTSKEINPRIVAFRELLRQNLGASCFRSPDDLATQVVSDLARELRKINLNLEQEMRIRTIHGEVLNLMKQKRFIEALNLNKQMLNSNNYSPRAHYNHACILSRLSEGEDYYSKKKKLLSQARSRMIDALKYGILKYILLYGDKADALNLDPPSRIISDEDLFNFFEEYPFFKDDVKNGYVPIHGSCGC